MAKSARKSPEKPPLRSQEDRSRSTRGKLLNATIEVLLRGGYSGLTMKEVAMDSGVSNGALMHHYANKATRQRMAQTAGVTDKLIEGPVTDCMSVYFDWPFLAALESIVLRAPTTTSWLASAR